MAEAETERESVMHFAILALTLDRPDERHIDRQSWHNFSGVIARTVENPAVKQIAPTVWQVDFRNNPGALAKLIDACEQFGYSYGILPFADEPPWIHRVGELQAAKRG
jgi:hypothetical protein